MSRKIKIRWKCPECGKRNRWTWGRWDGSGLLDGNNTLMDCGRCGTGTWMRVRSVKLEPVE